jgi:hypothetical protein
VFFHDTNLRRYYVRRDGSIGRAWDNQRGVIRATEDYVGTSFDETRDFVALRNGWLIRHSARCLGFTILERAGVDHGRGAPVVPSDAAASVPAGRR